MQLRVHQQDSNVRIFRTPPHFFKGVGINFPKKGRRGNEYFSSKMGGFTKKGWVDLKRGD